MGFNIFEFLKIENKEIIHSQFIASLLRNENYYNLFLEQINVPKNYIEWANANIRPEKILKGEKGKEYGRADIWIGEKKTASGRKKRIIIENKIYAGEQWLQLENYRSYLDEPGREGKLYYLTLEGKPAISFKKEQLSSANADKGYKTLSYGKEVLAWLQTCTDKTQDCLQLNAIEQYIKIIKDLTVLSRKLGDWEERNMSIDDIPKDNKKEYQTVIELLFWNELEKNIRGAINTRIDNRRHFSYRKVEDFNKKNKMNRSYGIVWKQDKGELFKRIEVRKDRNLYFSEGSFDDEWSTPKRDCILKLYFKTPTDAKQLAKDVYEKIK
jgi:hypothetical protein